MKIHIPHPEIIPAIRIESDGNRYYKTPEGNLYPSVTSVTGYESRLAIQQWKDKIGHDKANEISAVAANRGTRIHSYAEDYLNNKQVIPDMFDKQNWDLFLPLLKNIDNIHGVELKLYSDLLQVAGTADCIAEYNGVLSIIDFKTSRKLKDRSYITGYFNQCAFYAMAFRERTGLSVQQIVVLISVDDENPQVFIEDPKNWLLSAKKCRENFKLATGM